VGFGGRATADNKGDGRVTPEGLIYDVSAGAAVDHTPLHPPPFTPPPSELTEDLSPPSGDVLPAGGPDPGSDYNTHQGTSLQSGRALSAWRRETKEPNGK